MVKSLLLISPALFAPSTLSILITELFKEALSVNLGIQAITKALVQLLRPTIFLASIALATSLIVAPAGHADSGSPTFKLVSPSINSGFSYSSPFTLAFDLSGGWAQSLQSCGDISYEKFKFDTIIRVTPTQIIYVDWQSRGNGRTFFDWQTKINANGISCSLKVGDLNGAPGRWNGHLGLQATASLNDLFGNVEDGFEVEKVTGAQNVIFGWMVDGVKGTSTIVSKKEEPTIEFIGISRGDEITYNKSYTIRATIPNSFGESTAKLPDDCARSSKTDGPSSTVLIYECYSISKYLGTKELRMDITNGITSVSKSVLVNFIAAGEPQIEVEPTIVLTSDSQYNNEKFQAEIDVWLSLERDGDSPKIDFSKYSANVCVNTDCKTVMFDSKGTLKRLATVPHQPGAEVAWKVDVDFHGVKMTDSGSQSFSPIAKPIIVPKVPISIKYSVPATVRWGNAFPISIKAFGKGTARCTIWFQATSPTQGAYSIKLTAGKTSKISIRPTYYKLASWPISMRCWFSSGGQDWSFDSSLGHIVLTN